MNGGEAEEEAGKKGEKTKLLTRAKLIFKNIPPPFAFVDHFFLILINKWRSSSSEFFSLIFGRPLPQRRYELLKDDKFLNISQIDSLYEKFCFMTQKAEQELKGPEVVQVLSKYGYKFVTETSTGEEVFMNLRLKQVPSSNGGSAAKGINQS